MQYESSITDGTIRSAIGPKRPERPRRFHKSVSRAAVCRLAQRRQRTIVPRLRPQPQLIGPAAVDAAAARSMRGRDKRAPARRLPEEALLHLGDHHGRIVFIACGGSWSEQRVPKIGVGATGRVCS
jgi:hypothetical protein